MKTVKIYGIYESNNFEMCENPYKFSFTPSETTAPYYGDWDDCGIYYSIPKGYELVETKGEKCFYNSKGKQCVLTGDVQPIIVDFHEGVEIALDKSETTIENIGVLSEKYRNMALDQR